jgi:hypothetical protein
MSYSERTLLVAYLVGKQGKRLVLTHCNRLTNGDRLTTLIDQVDNRLVINP